MFRRLFALTLLATALAGLAGCGEKEATVSVGESEAIFVTLGDLQYQVQMSRQLNPADTGDSDLLSGIEPEEAQLGAKDLWFGVWVRVFNSSAKNVSTADTFKIADTRGEEFEPLIVDESNKFVFRKAPVEADGGEYPNPNSAAANLPTSGAILLFKLPYTVLSYRPLELEIESSEIPGKKATVTLDV